MDNKGYIFSTDAVLALVIFFVIAGSILTYYTLPSYIGADHQHLEAEADSVLALLTSDDNVKSAIITILSNTTTAEQKRNSTDYINKQLELLLPGDVNYNLNIQGIEPFVRSNGDNVNQVSRYAVISAPAEGWYGRAWYKLEDVHFKEKRVNMTQTLWNFNNYLCNFKPWTNYKHRLADFSYWGSKTTSADKNNGVQPISFSIPADAELKNASFIMGCTGMGTKNMIRPTSFTTKKIGSGFAKDYYPLDGVWDNTPGKEWGFGYRREYDRYEYYPLNWVDTGIRTPTFGANVTFNNNPSTTYVAKDSNKDGSIFDYILSINEDFYNGHGIIPIDWLHTGTNNFYVKFTNAATAHQMPWFSLLGEYETSIIVPDGVNTDRFPEKNESQAYDCAGAAKSGSYTTYDLHTGTTTRKTGTRQVEFSQYKGKDSPYANGEPFILKHATTANEDGSAIARIYDIDLTTNNEKISSTNVNVLDAYTVVNTYGATDKVLVEVYNGDKGEDGNYWHEVFNSQDNTDQRDSSTSNNKGYSNTPGTVYLGYSYGDNEADNFLKPNRVNKVRVTVFDDVGSSDYDFVGLVDTYNVVSFTEMPIRWASFPFESYQSDTAKSPNKITKSRKFTISSNAISEEKVMFFFGVGLDTIKVKLEAYDGSKTETLYEGSTIPFALDIGAIDAGLIAPEGSDGGKMLFAEPGGSSNYTAKTGDYEIRLSVWPSLARESGDQGRGGKDGAACAEIFSGSRIAVIYPKLLENEWITEYNETADGAKQAAVEKLTNVLNNRGYSFNPSLIKSEALYTGDMPNSIPIRLDLWRS